MKKEIKVTIFSEAALIWAKEINSLVKDVQADTEIIPIPDSLDLLLTIRLSGERELVLAAEKKIMIAHYTIKKVIENADGTVKFSIDVGCFIASSIKRQLFKAAFSQGVKINIREISGFPMCSLFVELNGPVKTLKLLYQAINLLLKDLEDIIDSI